MKGWSSLGVYDELEAKMIKNLLEENDIPVLLQQVDYALPVIFGSGGRYEIFVPESDEESALEVLKEVRGGEG